MVSFSCESCGDVLTKKKLDAHRGYCNGASFTCLDCMVHFRGTEYRSHTSCISEAQKYQGALYKPEKEKKGNNANNKVVISTPKKAYVEDELEESQRSHIVIVDPPPPAPTPPSALTGPVSKAVNVFDFLVDSETPNASRLELPAPEAAHAVTPKQTLSESRAIVSVQQASTSRQDSLAGLVEYGNGPVPNGQYRTPAPREERREKKEEKKERKDRSSMREEKKDKKRKRLHVETNRDEIMTDAPPILHSGLTGGLKGLLARQSVFPPSPDHSSGDAPETPGSPLKKVRHESRRKGSEGIANNLVAMITPNGGSKERERGRQREYHAEQRHRKERRSDRSPEIDQKGREIVQYRQRSPERYHDDEHRHHRGRSSSGERPDADGDAQMVIYRPRAEMLLDFVNKGPESERGISMNKALKRYHRERNATSDGLRRAEEEKELWKGLRMRRNELGEVVLFLV